MERAQPVTFRPFAGPSDFPAMVACANASFAADETRFFRTVEDVARDYAAFTSCVPQQDVWIAQAGDGIAGYVRSWHWEQAGGLQLYGQFAAVAPPWRRQGIGAQLHAWLETRQRVVAAARGHAGPHAHHAFVTQSETARAALLEKSGYRPERYFFTMVRPTLNDIAEFALPQGVELRAVQPEHWRAIWDAHQRAFRTHWGYAPPDEEDYQHWLASPVFQPHLWQIAWDRRQTRSPARCAPTSMPPGTSATTANGVGRSSSAWMSAGGAAAWRGR